MISPNAFLFQISVRFKKKNDSTLLQLPWNQSAHRLTHLLQKWINLYKLRNGYSPPILSFTFIYDHTLTLNRLWKYSHWGSYTVRRVPLFSELYASLNHYYNLDFIYQFDSSQLHDIHSSYFPTTENSDQVKSTDWLVYYSAQSCIITDLNLVKRTTIYGILQKCYF